MGETLCKMFRETTAKKISDVLMVFEGLGGNYVFRGQADKEWGLRTTFERATQGMDSRELATLEYKVMTEFKRRAHHYLSDLPKENHHLEWLALMQHHGCPTRLLDFTRSFFVGLFFAIEGSQSDSAVWAINRSYFEKNLGVPFSEEYLHSTYVEAAETRADEILPTPKEKSWEPSIMPVEPRRMNERLSIQQGLFLFPEDIRVSFEENLCAPLGKKSLSELAEKDGGLVVIKIVIPKKIHLQTTYLLSTMNINAATLFPGLDGFARSQMMYIKCAKHSKKAFTDLIREALLSDYVNRTEEVFEGIMKSERRSPQKEQ